MKPNIFSLCYFLTIAPTALAASFKISSLISLIHVIFQSVSPPSFCVCCVNTVWSHLPVSCSLVSCLSPDVLCTYTSLLHAVLIGSFFGMPKICKSAWQFASVVRATFFCVVSVVNVCCSLAFNIRKVCSLLLQHSQKLEKMWIDHLQNPSIKRSMSNRTC